MVLFSASSANIYSIRIKNNESLPIPRLTRVNIILMKARNLMLFANWLYTPCIVCKQSVEHVSLINECL